MRFTIMVQVALRSFFLESSWNGRNQQNLGLAAAIDPALRSIHKTGEPLLAARRRALDFFNTNPLASGLAIGIVLHLEERLAAGQLDARGRKRLLRPLIFTLASLGDALFWQAWLPFCSLMAVWAIISLESWWAPWLLPVLFGLLALPVRFSGLYWGYKKGPAAFEALDTYKITYKIRYLKRIVALLAGVSTVILTSGETGWRGDHLPVYLWMTVGSAALAVFALRFLIQTNRRLGYWFPALTVLAAIALVLGRRGPWF